MNITLHQQQSSSSSTSKSMADNVSSNTIPPPSVTKPLQEDKKESPVSLPENLRNRRSKIVDDIQLDFTLKSPEVIQDPPFQFSAEPEKSVPVETGLKVDRVCVEETVLPESASRTTESIGEILSVLPESDMTDTTIVLPKETSIERPLKKSVRRSLDFNESNNFEADEFEADQSIELVNEGKLKSKSPSLEQLGASAEVYSSRKASPVGLERERMEVKVLVHNESRDDSSFGTVSDDEDHDEPEPVSSFGYGSYIICI